jgi:uncharacterized protein (DUF1810 family)/O-acetyl-ADP-ribose deacetylase (regulator of RNase III)
MDNNGNNTKNTKNIMDNAEMTPLQLFLYKKTGFVEQPDPCDQFNADDPFGIEKRFLGPHRKHYTKALKELRETRKKNHWFWYWLPIPQPRVDGFLIGDANYALRSDAQVHAFLDYRRDGVNFRKNYMNLVAAIRHQVQNGCDLRRLFGLEDYTKVISSVILFERIGKARNDDKLHLLCGHVLVLCGERDILFPLPSSNDNSGDCYGELPRAKKPRTNYQPPIADSAVSQDSQEGDGLYLWRYAPAFRFRQSLEMDVHRWSSKRSPKDVTKGPIKECIETTQQWRHANEGSKQKKPNPNGHNVRFAPFFEQRLYQCDEQERVDKLVHIKSITDNVNRSDQDQPILFEEQYGCSSQSSPQPSPGTPLNAVPPGPKFQPPIVETVSDEDSQEEEPQQESQEAPSVGATLPSQQSPSADNNSRKRARVDVPSGAFVQMATYELANNRRLIITDGPVEKFRCPLRVGAIAYSANQCCLKVSRVAHVLFNAGGENFKNDRDNLPSLGWDETMRSHIRCHIGDAKIMTTRGEYGSLQVKHVIHAVGPSLESDCVGDTNTCTVHKTYASALNCTLNTEIQVVAFSLLSCELYDTKPRLERLVVSGVQAISDWSKGQTEQGSSKLEDIFLCGVGEQFMVLKRVCDNALKLVRMNESNKRTANRQITKDDDEEGAGDEKTAEGVVKADAEVLKKRRIAKDNETPASANNSGSDDKPKVFGSGFGYSGFASAAASTSNGFGSSATGNETPASADPPNNSGSDDKPKVFGSGFGYSGVTSAASSTGNGFGSGIGKSSTTSTASTTNGTEFKGDEDKAKETPAPPTKATLKLPAEVKVTTGEEDEHNLFEARVKVFKLVLSTAEDDKETPTKQVKVAAPCVPASSSSFTKPKPDDTNLDGKPKLGMKWQDIGVGPLKLLEGGPNKLRLVQRYQGKNPGDRPTRVLLNHPFWKESKVMKTDFKYLQLDLLVPTEDKTLKKITYSIKFTQEADADSLFEVLTKQQQENAQSCSAAIDENAESST